MGSYFSYYSSSSRPSDDIAASVSPHNNGLSGKVAIVTGPTNGIGYETARVLAKHGAHVFLAARNSPLAEKCKQKLIEEIKAELPDAQPRFTVLQMDLSSLASVRTAANAFLSSGLPLHLLINNAGMFALKPTSDPTADGLESHVGVNYLAHYYLTRLLLPKLRSTATPESPAKVVNLTSYLHTPKLNGPEDIEKTFPNDPANFGSMEAMQAYNRSKLYNIYYAQTLARTEASHNVLAYAAHPGVVATNMNHDGILPVRLLLKVMYYFMSGTNAGASTTIQCAMREGVENSGKYFADAKVAEPKPIALNDAMRAKLMEISEKIVVEFETKNPL